VRWEWADSPSQRVQDGPDEIEVVADPSLIAHQVWQACQGVDDGAVVWRSCAGAEDWAPDFPGSATA
jgi:hypothetical protein